MKFSAVLLSALGVPSVAFLLPKQSAPVARLSQPLDKVWRVQVAQIDAPASKSNEKEFQQQGWECDDEANCVQVDACNEEECRTSLDVRIHGEWYDLSGWRKSHPAGEHWIDWYDGRDATEVMDAFHSDKGRKMAARLPKSVEPTATMLEAMAEPDTQVQKNFRKFRAELEEEGWWKRDLSYDYKQIGIWASLVVLAAATAHTVAPVSIMALSLSLTAAGWLGHDYCHGIDDFSMKMRNFAAVCAGLLPTWWVDKHNKHHALSKCKTSRFVDYGSSC